MDELDDYNLEILTPRDVDLCLAMVKWIDTVRKTCDKNFLPTEPDIDKSRLFWRCRMGKDPLKYAPPRAYSCPWYELIDEPNRPHWTYDIVHRGEKVYFAQCGYKLVEMDAEGKPSKVQFGPYLFRCWYGVSAHDKELFGWWLQLERIEESNWITPT